MSNAEEKDKKHHTAPDVINQEKACEDFTDISFSKPNRRLKPRSPNEKKALLIHGGDSKITEKVFRILRECHIPDIFHHDQNKGDFLLRKYAKIINVDLAIVVLSSDTFVYGKDEKPGDAFMQADQDVILELGYWLGRLGRNKVFVLCKSQGRFRQPAKFFDIYYIPFGTHLNWEKELKAHLRKEGLGD